MWEDSERQGGGDESASWGVFQAIEHSHCAAICMGVHTAIVTEAGGHYTCCEGESRLVEYSVGYSTRGKLNIGRVAWRGSIRICAKP